MPALVDAAGNIISVGEQYAWGAMPKRRHQREGLRIGTLVEVDPFYFKVRGERLPGVRLKGSAVAPGGWMRPEAVVRIVVPSVE